MMSLDGKTFPWSTRIGQKPWNSQPCSFNNFGKILLFNLCIRTSPNDEIYLKIGIERISYKSNHD